MQVNPNIKPVILLLFALSYLSASAQKQVEIKDDHVILYPVYGKIKAIQLKAISAQIIQVKASAELQIKKDTTLMVVDQPEFKNWRWSQTATEGILSTSSLKAIVSLKTGDVRFTDVTGKIILHAEKDGSQMNSINIENGTAYSITQTFASKPDEAFYGLGQHQQGIMNYKGHAVELLQTNTEVAIPFLVSSKNYGILWDNYSITQFSDGRSYQPLNKLQLFDSTGKVGGLTASYKMKNDESKIVTQRIEDQIAYEFLPSLEKLPGNYSLADGKVIWQGFLQSSYSGLHKFSIKYGGYINFWVDGKLLLNRWRVCWNPATAIISTNLIKGKKHAIKIEWIPDCGESFIAVNWMRPATDIENKRFQLQSEAGDNINYYFVYGKNIDEVISGYRQLTGKAPIVPKWALGFWQSRERYKTQEEVISTVREFRRRKIPLDNIVLDWQYWKPDDWGSQEFDASRFPDPQGMIDSIHNVYKARIMISVWPKFYTGIKNFNNFNEKGWLLTRNIEDNRKDWLGHVSTFYDAFNPDAAKGFWKLLEDNLYSKGVDAWWMDASEPDIHSNLSIEQKKRIMYPNAIGSAVKYFNAYPLVNVQPIYDGQRYVDPHKRVFILTRSGYAGSQRYGAAVWSGDIGSRWHDLKDQISAGINFSMSGLPYWTMDIGGFAVERRFENAKGEDDKEWKELQTRWYQFGAFTPLFRSHGQYPFREVFNIASETDTAYQSMLFYNKLRYRLLPYIYSLAGKSYHDDYTIMRGLVMDFPSDLNVKNINDQFLFGPSLLINPVYNYKQRNKRVYFPKGVGWYDLYTGKFFNGGQTTTVTAPYHQMPVYVKEGSIIPFGPELQYTSEKPADSIHLYVYTGKDASFTLYEDEATNYNYEQGKFSTILISYNEKTKSLTIGDRKGSFPEMLQTRVFIVTAVSKERSVSLTFNKFQFSTIYSGKQVTLKLM